MSEQFFGYRLLTHRYNPDYSYMEDQEYVGDFVILNRRARITREDIEEPTQVILTIKAPKGATEKDVYDVCYNEFRRGCSHDFDCCGCWHGGVREVRHFKKREWIVTAHYARSY